MRKSHAYLAKQELLDREVNMLVPQRHRGLPPAVWSDFFSEPSSLSKAAELSLFGRHKDGHEGQAEIRVGTIGADNSGMTLACISTAGDFVVVADEDNGCGMDEVTATQACEPFFTTKGLRRVRSSPIHGQGFAHQSGGRIRVKSEIGRRHAHRDLPAASRSA